MISEKTSSDLFNKVRSKFSNIQLGDDLGNVTADPRSAVFFDFEFREDAENFGRVSVSIADGETMKVFYNMGLVEKLQDQDKTAWYSFLKELKDFAVEHQIGFDVRDISKSNLSQQDYKNLADTNKTVNTAGMSEELNRITKLAGVAKAPVAEGLTGTSKSSYESLDKTKLIVRHSKPVESNMPGARTRHINSLYIENEQGERFKYPIVHLAGARAMQRHIANGGVPHDQFGEHIVKMSEQIAQLNSFSRYTANKDQLNDSAGDIIEKAKMKLETMRKYVKGLSKQKNYESIKETFQPTTIAEIDEETKNNLKDKFTLKHFDEKIDQVLPLISSIMSEYDDADAEADANDKDAQNSPIVDQGSIIQGFLSDPNKKLILRLDDAMDKFNNTITRFTGPNAGNARLTTILSDIGSRMLSNGDNDDHIANFASSMSDQIGNEDAPFWKPTVDYVKNKKIAIQLAKRYLDDYNKLSRDPEYKNEVRKDPQDFKKFKNIKGKEYGDKSKEYAKQESPEAQFESWATNIVEGTDQPMIIDGKEVDESTIEYDMQDYGDLIAPISDAKFIDGTDLTPEQQEELESSTWYANWVMTDYNERQVESAEQPVENVSIDDEYRFRDWLKKTHNKQVHELKPQEYEIISKQYRDEKNKTEEQPVEEDASDDALAQELAKYFHGIADGYPKDQHGDQEHEEMTSIADAFKTDGLQAGMNDINTSRFEFSSNPFDQDGSGDMDDDMMMLLKKHGVSAKMKGALAYLVKGSKAITNPEEETATEGNDETVAELDDKQRTASSLKYSSDPRVAYFDKMMKRYGPKLTELIIDYSHVISNNEQKVEEKLKKYGKGYAEFLDYYRQMHGVEEDFIDMLTTAVEEEEGLINFFYDRVEQAKKAGQFAKTSRLLDPDQTESAVQEGHYPHSKSFDKLYGINDKQQYKAMADDAQSMDMGEFMDTYSSVIDMAGDFWEDHKKPRKAWKANWPDSRNCQALQKTTMKIKWSFTA